MTTKKALEEGHQQPDNSGDQYLENKCYLKHSINNKKYKTCKKEGRVVYKQEKSRRLKLLRKDSNVRLFKVFNIARVNLFTELKETMLVKTEEHMRTRFTKNVNKDREFIKKNQTEVLQLESVSANILNS